MIMGFFIGFLLSAAITSLAFWTTRVYSIHEFYYALILLFSGQFVPLTLMPKLIQDIAQYLPFQLLIYYPIQLILGKLIQRADRPGICYRASSGWPSPFLSLTGSGATA